MSPRRALVCALMPEHDRDSGSRRVLHLLDFLQQAGWGVTFVSHHEHPRARYVNAFQQRGIEVYAGSSKWMDQLVATGHFDLVVMALWEIAEASLERIREKSPATRVVIDTIDLHFLRNARRRFLTDASRGPGSLDQGYGSDFVRELNTYAAADLVLAVSQKEADLVNDLVGDPTLAVAVPDGEDISPSSVPIDQRRGMVFVGCYRFAPNLEAVQYLFREILPRVEPELLVRHPVYIVGDGLTDEIRQLAGDAPWARMVGWVPEVEPYLTHSRISIVPLLHGAGTKRKVVQALMHGTPTVSTGIGIEGLALEPGRHVLVADDAQTFAESIARLLTDDERLWHRLGHEGATHVARMHRRNVASTRMAEAVQVACSKTPKAARTPSRGATSQPAMASQDYHGMIERIRTLVGTSLPSDCCVMVVSKGDDALVRLGDRTAWHFPQTPEGRYAGAYPADSDAAIAEVERLRARGAEYLLFPSSAVWWLDHYAGLREHLDGRYELALRADDTCVVYALGRRGDERVVVSGHQPAMTAPVDMTNAADVRLVAFLLPQFHPIPENDGWWGKGFTEWTNVAAARPRFPDHYQPHLPADLGFYDLRMREARLAQAEMAKAFGIHGFCYYHYWFNGKRLLEHPFNEVLRTGEPGLPFCLCWANEPWSRRWDGRPRDVLQPQLYGHDDDVAHFRWLLQPLTDSRAIQIDGRPVLIVYQSKELPNAARTIDTWREEAHKAGLQRGLYLIACETGWDAEWDATSVGFDAKVLFQPQFSMLFGSGSEITMGAPDTLRVFDYQRAWRVLANPKPVPYRRYDTVFPSWDNTARAGDRAVVLHNSTPDAYQRWLEHAIERAAKRPRDQRIVFLNAWNEWGEGCHLEPDQRHGLAYLEATTRALSSYKGQTLAIDIDAAERVEAARTVGGRRATASARTGDRA